MYHFIQSHQVTLLMAGAMFCAFLTIFIGFMKFRSLRRKKALFRLEFSTAVMLLAEALLLIFEGVPGAMAHYILVICHFLSYLTICTDIYFLNAYMTSAFMETGKFRKLPKQLLAGFILSSVGMTLIVISQFTHMYYFIDANNAYNRGPLFMLSYAMPLATLIVETTFVLQHHKKLGKRIFISLIAFELLPLAASMLQILYYGISFTEMSIGLGAIILFLFALNDMNDELMHSANTEVHTGLPNTYGYLYEVDNIMETQDITEYNSYYFDIVRMGQVNNKYGKDVGDEVIRLYAAYIRKHLDKDEILGRLGGNYFVALVKKVHTDEFLEMLQDVPVDVKLPGRTETLHLAAVAGAYSINNKNIASGQILGNTATAVTYAKNVAHRPYVFMDDQMEAELTRTRELEEKALVGMQNGEFKPYYQPKVDPNTGMLTGAEALVRWDLDGRLVLPSEFVSLLEKNGRICELDMMMLRQVCRDLADWIARGLDPVRISTNFSRKNLDDPELADRIAEIVRKSGVPVDLIQIEVTETLDEYPVSVLRSLVDGLHSHGITTAIDDFGTGSSSISLLREIPFDVLKIDKFFVECPEPVDEKLLGQIIEMSDSLDLSVIAEGVEEKTQLERLMRMGCGEIQGFIYDVPLDHDAFEKRLQNRKYDAPGTATDHPDK